MSIYVPLKRNKTKLYSDGFPEFKKYKCVKCKMVFRINNGASGNCTNCEKGKVQYEKYREAAL